MQKKFAGSLALLLFLNFLIKPIWIFGIDLTVQNRVGEAAYGLYSAILSFTLIFNIILDVGVTHYNNRSVAHNATEVIRNFSYLTSLKLFLALIYLIVSAVAGHLFGYTSNSFALWAILTLNQFLSSLILFFRSHLSGLQLFKTDALMSILDKTLMVLICGLLLYPPVFDNIFSIKSFAIAQLLSYVITAVVAFILVFKEVRIFSWRFRFQHFKRGLYLGYPYALLILLMGLYTRMDSIMLEQIIGAAEAGVYAHAYRILDAVNQLGYLFSVLLLPLFAGMIGRKESVKNLVNTAFGLIITLYMGVALVLGIFSNEIISVLYKDYTPEAAEALKLLGLSSLGFATTYIYGTWLTSLGRLKVLNLIALGGFILNFVLNLWLIPKTGAAGAAMATCITQLSTAVIQLIYAVRYSEASLHRESAIGLAMLLLYCVMVLQLE